MFDTGFIITLVVSCISSGALVIATTLASEKLGGTFGGIVGSMPLLETIASVSIALTDSVPSAKNAMLICPISGFGGTISYMLWKVCALYIERVIKKRAIAIGVVVSIIFVEWLALCVPLALWGMDAMFDALGFAYVLSISLLFLFITFVIGAFAKMFEFSRTKQSSSKVSIWKYLLRGSLGCGLMLAVNLFSLLNASLAAALSTFPVFSITSFTTLWWTNGPTIVSEVASTMTLGTVVCYAYTLIFALMVTSILGLWGTAVVANVIAIVIILPLLFILRLHDREVEKRLGTTDQVLETQPEENTRQENTIISSQKNSLGASGGIELKGLVEHNIEADNTNV